MIRASPIKEYGNFSFLKYLERRENLSEVN